MAIALFSMPIDDSFSVIFDSMDPNQFHINHFKIVEAPVGHLFEVQLL